MATQKDFKCLLTHLTRMKKANDEAMKYLERFKSDVKVGRVSKKSKVANDKVTKTTRTKKKAVA